MKLAGYVEIGIWVCAVVLVISMALAMPALDKPKRLQAAAQEPKLNPECAHTVSDVLDLSQIIVGEGLLLFDDGQMIDELAALDDPKVNEILAQHAKAQIEIERKVLELEQRYADKHKGGP